MALILAGLLLSLIGSLPPGLISLLVARVAIQKGQKAALWVAVGASIVEFWQAWFASTAALWLLAHPMIEYWFQWGALVVFGTIGIYLLGWAPRPKPLDTGVMQVSALQHIGQGALVSLFNLLALPYWFAYCGWLKLNGWWAEGTFSTCLFSTGVGLGTMLALSLYAWAGQKMMERSDSIGRSANRLIGILFLLLAAKILLKML